MKFHLGFFLTPKLSYFLLSLFVYFSYKLTKEKLTNLPTYKTYELTKLQNFKLTIYSKQSTSSFFFFKEWYLTRDSAQQQLKTVCQRSNTKHSLYLSLRENELQGIPSYVIMKQERERNEKALHLILQAESIFSLRTICSSFPWYVNVLRSKHDSSVEFTSQG